MYAIVDIAGQQFKVEKDQKIYVHRIEGEEGSKVEFDQVLLIEDDGKVNVGAPVVDGALISGKIVAHLKGDKVQIFKKKRRKGYQTLNGHRQQFTELLIEGIAANGAKKAAKKEEKPKSEAKTEAKSEPKKETKQTSAKKAEPAKTEEKKETKAAKPKTESKKAKPAAKKKETKAAAKDEPKKAAPKKAAPKAEKKDDSNKEAK